MEGRSQKHDLIGNKSNRRRQFLRYCSGYNPFFFLYSEFYYLRNMVHLGIHVALVLLLSCMRALTPRETDMRVTSKTLNISTHVPPATQFRVCTYQLRKKTKKLMLEFYQKEIVRSHLSRGIVLYNIYNIIMLQISFAWDRYL